MENLTIIRKESHATQQEVADYLGISRQAYGNYESGKREPDYETLLKLGESRKNMWIVTSAARPMIVRHSNK